MKYIFVTVTEYPNRENPAEPMRVIGIERRLVPDVGSTYDLLREHVGGFIEYVVMPEPCEFEIIVNEEGAFCLPYNPLVSQFWLELWLKTVSRRDLDMSRMNIHGPAVITGPNGGDVTDNMWARFCEITGAGDPYEGHAGPHS